MRHGASFQKQPHPSNVFAWEKVDMIVFAALLSRGMRKKAAAEQAEEATKPSSQDDAFGAAPTRCTKTWAMLIKRVYEVDPLSCPRCGSDFLSLA